MADDIVLNAGAGGPTLATDDVAGRHFQRFKPTLGADGTATDAVPVSNGMDVTGAAVQAVGLVAQLDDTATGPVTENQFAPVRLSSARRLLVDPSGVTSPISAASLPLPTGAATEATLAAVNTTSNFDSKIGSLTETAPATDIASSGLNGRLQRIAQRLTSLIALLPSALVGGRLDVNLGGSSATVTVDSELPAAAAMADAAANPTAPAVDSRNGVFNGTTWDRLRGSTTGLQTIGGLAHDDANTSANRPLVRGAEAIAHGANPTAVAAGDVTKLYANRHGVPFVIPGHPNVQTLRVNYTAAQTDTAIVTVSGGTKIVVTRVESMVDKATTVDVAVRIGFGATTTPTGAGVLQAHPGLAAGSGIVSGAGSGILGVGGDGEDLRITSEVPTTGSLDVVVSYYTIES